MDSNKEQLELTATIVLFKNDISILKKTIQSFLRIPVSKKLFLVDNSPSNILKKEFLNDEIEYIFLNKNIGFGAAHNIVQKKIKDRSKFHLVLNPDVTFQPKVIPNLIKKLEKEKEVALIAPRVQYKNGKHQYSCRRFPTFFELIVRRIPFSRILFKKIIEKGEYKDKDLKKSFYAEYISGCFQLYKTKDFLLINGFDERYFMYMEDIDICRKLVNNKKRNLYYPEETIIHLFEKGSAKKIKLFIYHIISIFQYFYKWNITNSK